MILDDADSRLHHVDMTAEESVFQTMDPSKRRCTSVLIRGQRETLQPGDEDEEIGLSIFDSFVLPATIQPTITTHDDQKGIQPDSMIDPPRRIRTPRKKKHLVRDGHAPSHQQLRDASRKGTKPNAGTKP